MRVCRNLDGVTTWPSPASVIRTSTLSRGHQPLWPSVHIFLATSPTTTTGNSHAPARPRCSRPLDLTASASSRNTAASYSRTSWRAAIFSETDANANSPTHPQPLDTPSTSGIPSILPAGTEGADFTDNHSSSEEQSATEADDGQREPVVGAADGGPDCAEWDVGGGGGTLSAAELRVKLALAAGSGRLDFTDCRLRELPPQVLGLTELEELQLSGNCLTALPEGLSRLTALRRLGLAGNLLTALPAGIGALGRLEGLWLHGNRLTSLPRELGGLGALRALSLAGNCLESLPSGSLCRLTALTDLTLAGNRLTHLPPGELAPLTRLRKLALNGNRLEGSGTAAPGGQLGLGLGPHMTALNELMLQGNCLTEVDPGVFKCPALCELSLADNRLTVLPPNLAGATSLSRLHLFGNRLTHLAPRQLAALPALTTCWLEGNPLMGEAVAELVLAAGGGGMPALKALGLDQTQVAAWRAAGVGARRSGGGGRGLSGGAAVEGVCQEGGSEGAFVGERKSSSSGSGDAGHGIAWSGDGPSLPLPGNVRVGCVLGSGPGYFKLQYGPQRPPATKEGPSAGDSQSGGGGCVDGHDRGAAAAATETTTPPGGASRTSGGGSDGAEDDGVTVAGDSTSDSTAALPRSSNELLVVAFGSAPGTPNWGGLLSRVYQAAASEEERYFDVLYVADPSRDWYGGGDDARHTYYRSRLAAYTARYRRVVLLGDSMGATAALLFADLATAALAFCPQVDLTAASIRPGRPAAELDRLRGRLMGAVRGSAGELQVLVGTWQHDLAQANLLPQRAGNSSSSSGGGGGRGEARGADAVEGAAGADAAGSDRSSRSRKAKSWRRQEDESGDADGVSGSAAVTARREAVASAAYRSPWAWQQEKRVGDGDGGSGSSAFAEVRSRSPGLGGGGVSVRVFAVDSHRLAAALDARGKLVQLVREMLLHQLGLRSGIVRLSNLL